MSLIVKILINRTEIVNLIARRLEPIKGQGEAHNYITNYGDIITHTYSDGAEVLAMKLLDLYKTKTIIH